MLREQTVLSKSHAGPLVARTRNSLSATHSLSVNFRVRVFCGSSSVSGADFASATFVSSVLVAATVDMMVIERERGP